MQQRRRDKSPHGVPTVVVVLAADDRRAAETDESETWAAMVEVESYAAA